MLARLSLTPPSRLPPDPPQKASRGNGARRAKEASGFPVLLRPGFPPRHPGNPRPPARHHKTQTTITTGREIEYLAVEVVAPDKIGVTCGSDEAAACYGADNSGRSCRGHMLHPHGRPRPGPHHHPRVRPPHGQPAAQPRWARLRLRRGRRRQPALVLRPRPRGQDLQPRLRLRRGHRLGPPAARALRRGLRARQRDDRLAHAGAAALAHGARRAPHGREPPLAAPGQPHQHLAAAPRPAPPPAHPDGLDRHRRLAHRCPAAATTTSCSTPPAAAAR